MLSSFPRNFRAVRIFALSGIMLLAPAFLLYAQQGKKEMEAGYYVVVGAYSVNKEWYAKKYVETISSMGKEADYGFNSRKNLYFVYLDFSNDYQAAINQMRQTRKGEQFSDAWVFVCGGGAKGNTTETTSSTGQNLNDNDQDQADSNAKVTTEADADTEKDVTTTDRNAEEADVTNEAIAENTDNDVDADVDEDSDDDDSAVDEDATETEGEDEGAVKKGETGTLSDYRIYVDLANARNKEDVNGEVKVIDAERAKLIKTLPGGEYSEIPDPDNRTGNLTLIADVFGYRKNQKNLNYYHPFKDTTATDVEVMSDIYKINFDMIRYHKGDIVVMYNVYYFNDAAIMRPESKFEVNSLLEMMEENPKYKIRIHGHTNGKSPGKIITMNQSKEFFALTSGNKEGFGTAKELSKERAEVIRQYLISKGVDADRMEVKAWGGRRMLYDKFSSQAKNNVRVEIEILEE